MLAAKIRAIAATLLRDGDDAKVRAHAIIALYSVADQAEAWAASTAPAQIVGELPDGVVSLAQRRATMRRAV